MQATVVGIKKTDFVGDRGVVKATTFHCIVEDPDMDEGQKVDTLRWDEMQKGKPPAALKIGSKINTRYNDKGRLALDETA